MKIFVEEFRLLLKKLLDNNIEFILIGGYAVNYHGYNRPTGDLDIWLRPDDATQDKLLKLLMNEGFSKKSIAQIAELDFTKPATFFLGQIPKRIDFLTQISGVKFDEAWEQRQLLPLEKYNVPVLHLHHLILSKMSNDRTRDKADIEELQRIQQLKNKK